MKHWHKQTYRGDPGRCRKPGKRSRDWGRLDAERLTQSVQKLPEDALLRLTRIGILETVNTLDEETSQAFRSAARRAWSTPDWGYETAAVLRRTVDAARLQLNLEPLRRTGPPRAEASLLVAAVHQDRLEAAEVRELGQLWNQQPVELPPTLEALYFKLVNLAGSGDVDAFETPQGVEALVQAAHEAMGVLG